MNEFLNELNKDAAPNPNDNIFSDMWKEYERVIMQSLVTSFGLDFLVHDQRGGDVDTVHSVQETVEFKNQAYTKKYDERGAYDPYPYHSGKAYRDITAAPKEEFNEKGTTINDAYASCIISVIR